MGPRVSGQQCRPVVLVVQRPEQSALRSLQVPQAVALAPIAGRARAAAVRQVSVAQARQAARAAQLVPSALPAAGVLAVVRLQQAVRPVLEMAQRAAQALMPQLAAQAAQAGLLRQTAPLALRVQGRAVLAAVAEVVLLGFLLLLARAARAARARSGMPRTAPAAEAAAAGVQTLVPAGLPVQAVSTAAVEAAAVSVQVLD